MRKRLKSNILLFSEKILIKPLSVNEAWQGKKFKTPKYKEYEKALMALLPDVEPLIDAKPLEIFIEVGFSNKQSDIDNIVKPFVDILQKKYKFNDRFIYKMTVEKHIVEKGNEYIEFYIKNKIPSHNILEDLDN